LNFNLFTQKFKFLDIILVIKFRHTKLSMNLAQFSRSMTISKSESTNEASHATGIKRFKKSVSDSKLFRRIKSLTKLGSNSRNSSQAQVELTNQANRNEPSKSNDIKASVESKKMSHVSKSWRLQSRSSGSLLSAQGTCRSIQHDRNSLHLTSAIMISSPFLL
jgi:hypothetical protein